MQHQLCYNHAIDLAVVNVMYKSPEISNVISSEFEPDDDEQIEESDNCNSNSEGTENSGAIAQQEPLHPPWILEIYYKESEK